MVGFGGARRSILFYYSRQPRFTKQYIKVRANAPVRAPPVLISKRKPSWQSGYGSASVKQNGSKTRLSLDFENAFATFVPPSPSFE